MKLIKRVIASFAIALMVGTLLPAKIALASTQLDQPTPQVTQSIAQPVAANVASIQFAAGQKKFVKAGDNLVVDVIFDQDVSLTGSASLALKLSDSKSVDAASVGTLGNQGIEFAYQVQQGDSSDGGYVDVTGANALTLSSGSTIQTNGVDSNLALPYQGGSTLLLGEVVVDTLAPIITDYKTFWDNFFTKLDPQFPTSIIPDGFGVYVTEETKSALITGNWTLDPASKAGNPVFDVALYAQDAAGNVSVPLVRKVNLKAQIDPNDVIPIETAIGLNLYGDQVVKTEKGKLYQDKGVSVNFEGSDFAHLWMTGTMDTQVTGQGELTFNATSGLLPVLSQQGAQSFEQSLNTPKSDPSGSVTREVSVVDTTPTGPVSNVGAQGLDSKIQLNWANPVADDFDHVSIYRSTQAGVQGNYLDYVSKPNNSYLDSSLTNGTTYYYTLIAYDNAGNASAPIVVSATPVAPEAVTLAVATTTSSIDQSQTPSVQEIKASTKGTDDSGKDGQNKSLPIFGISVLLLLIFFGLYLLYQQRPEWFEWMLFWKKKPTPKSKK